MKLATLAMFALVVCSTPAVALASKVTSPAAQNATPANAKMMPVAVDDLIEEISAYSHPYGIDQIVTGQKISTEEMGLFNKRRQKFLECPSCVMSQPYPFD